MIMIALFLFSLLTQAKPLQDVTVEALADLESSLANGTVFGQATFTQQYTRGNGLHPTHVKIQLSGLPANKSTYQVGWHIHQLGNLSRQDKGRCMSSGSHYNPGNVSHGSPTALSHHVGDLGNLPIRDDGTAIYESAFDFIHLLGKHSVVGRTLVIHTGQDDLGLDGGDSKLTGNAGGRAACGIIAWSKEPGEALEIPLRELYTSTNRRSHQRQHKKH